ncbi:MAG: AtpZ/AtpI family protein, partial [Micromonosporaceae bacterium]|nr:AtpZ/AtpI family protein [Micromonosporaceae bacterium]
MGTRSQPSAWDLLSLGAANAVCIVGGLGIGWLVDRIAGTAPIFLFVGLVLGIAAGIMFSYSKLR